MKPKCITQMLVTHKQTPPNRQVQTPKTTSTKSPRQGHQNAVSKQAPSTSTFHKHLQQEPLASTSSKHLKRRHYAVQRCVVYAASNGSVSGSWRCGGCGHSDVLLWRQRVAPTGCHNRFEACFVRRHNDVCARLSCVSGWTHFLAGLRQHSAGNAKHCDCIM